MGCERQSVGQTAASVERNPIATWRVSSRDLIGLQPDLVFLHICPHPTFVLPCGGPAGSNVGAYPGEGW